MENTAAKIEFPKPLQGIRLLLVEDYLDNQLLISRGLKYLGAIVDVADNGQEAVDKASQQDYDSILMDIQMPGLDGLEATKLLRTKNYTKPIIALTAHATKEEKDRLLSSGFNDYVVKPIDRQVLVSAILKATRPSG